jgi:hypothetical protein
MFRPTSGPLTFTLNFSVTPGRPVDRLVVAVPQTDIAGFHAEIDLVALPAVAGANRTAGVRVVVESAFVICRLAKIAVDEKCSLIGGQSATRDSRQHASNGDHLNLLHLCFPCVVASSPPPHACGRRILQIRVKLRNSCLWQGF